jgi:mannose-6-phosphate isomerase-like protein (cupin superfamily)
VNRFFKESEVRERRAEAGKPFYEFLRVPAMSAGLYVLPANSTDPQKPHRQDEIYYVVSGRARMRIIRDEAREDRLVTAGSIIYVESGTEHSFHSIEEELAVIVIFAPAEIPA